MATIVVFLENVISQTASQVGPSDGFIFVQMITSDSQYDHHGGYLKNVISQTASLVGPSDGYLIVSIPDLCTLTYFSYLLT